jgi:hypothetical protein
VPKYATTPSFNIKWYDIINLTAIELPPGGSSTEHIYTQTIYRSTQTIHRNTQTIHRIIYHIHISHIIIYHINITYHITYIEYISINY